MAKKSTSIFQAKKKQIITGSLVFLALLVAVGAGVYFSYLQHRSQGNGSNGSGAPVTGLPQDTLLPVVQDAKDQASSGNYDQSNNTLTDAIAASKSNDEKYELYLQQGINYQNQQQYDNAIAAYKNAEALKQTSSVYQALGDVEAAKGDKTAAVADYKKAISLMDTKVPLYQANKQQLEQTITELGG